MSVGARRLAHPIGAIIHATVPEQIAARARMLEDLGFSHILVPEDGCRLPATVAATIALSATRTIEVGTGIVSVMTRHPALLAMEIAAITRTFPDRFRPGIGLGLPSWLEQLGLAWDRPVRAVSDRVSSLRRLLEGETVSIQDGGVTMDAVALVHAPNEDVPIAIGAMGPLMLQLAGELGDTTLLSVTSGVKYVGWARRQVERGMGRRGRSPDSMRYGAYALACVDPDGERARVTARPALAALLAAAASIPPLAVYGISERVISLRARGGANAVAAEMQAQWIEDLALVGTPAEVASKARSWLDAGLHSICLSFPDESNEDSLQLVADQVIPQLAAGATPRASQRSSMQSA